MSEGPEGQHTGPSHPPWDHEENQPNPGGL